MTDLTPEDLAILEREKCLVDAEAAAIACYMADARNSLTLPDWSEVPRSWKQAREAATAAALRAAGLEPGQPAEHLIRAACQRRNWVIVPDEIWPNINARVVVKRIVVGAGRHPTTEGSAPGYLTALSIAFVAAVRASEGATE